MCMICFNSQWRAVCIGVTGAVISLSIFFVTAIYRQPLEEYLNHPDRRPSHSLSYSSADHTVDAVLAWLFPWPFWVALITHFILSFMLVVSATYKFLHGVTTYLILDAAFVGLLATFLCLAFLAHGLVRVTLLTALFPLFSLGTCAWMAVFALYLRLEDRERRRRKRRRTAGALLRSIEGDQFDNLGFCETSYE